MSARWEPSIEDFIDVATYLLGADRLAIARLLRLALAESTLHAPFASHGGVEAYPTLLEQAAVLLERLAMNHRLPDANRRAAFVLTARFLDGGLTWRSQEADTDAASSSVWRPARRDTKRSSIREPTGETGR